MQQEGAQQAVEQVKKDLAPALNTIVENQMLEKYPDYNDLAPDRTLIQTKALSQEMPWTEVFQLAAQGANLPGALAAAEKAGYQKAMDDIASKKGASFPSGGAQPPDKGKPHDPNDPEYLRSTLHHLGNVR